MRATKYHVRYERDQTGWWVADVKEVKGCHTQGRTVDEARRRIREALSLFVDDADTAPLMDEVKLPKVARKAILAYRSTRRRAEAHETRARFAARRAVQILHSGTLKMSLRDTSAILGISHQRVSQLLEK